jgi:hypothetical protein
LIVVRWILVVLAILVWLLIVPVVELVAVTYRTVARLPIFRRADERLVPVGSRSHEEGPASPD